ncbi:hypothetical protein RJ641_036410 [Dillenia turbinata]|uniref:Methyltransferase-like protein 13 n=1 Tax=Dillenia turbinata TaxID=194707 RepID=A0AAN8VP59_9MAGN
MAIDGAIFETINPSQFTTFTFPFPDLPIPLRVAVLDSPLQAPTAGSPPKVAAMLVPFNRENDWIFSTQSGHLQLILNSPNICRLILVGPIPRNRNNDDLGFSEVHYVSSDDLVNRGSKFEEDLLPLLLALCPRQSFQTGNPQIPFLCYEDDLIRSLTIGVFEGVCVGEMLVEDVEMTSGDGKEFRRRLRFKRMPNLVQTQMVIMPELSNKVKIFGLGEVKFEPQIRVLVHPYLIPMVAALSLIGGYFEERILNGFMPKALCLGVGGGALLAFLRAQLGFEVVGVEIDEAVLDVAKKYFGLEDNEFLRVLIGDAVDYLERFAKGVKESELIDVVKERCVENVDGVGLKFDVVMVDLDAGDARNGMSAPPLEFVSKPMLLNARMVLSEYGILVMNVIPSSRSLYEGLLPVLREVFCELYEIDVGNGENYVVIASESVIKTSDGDCENSFSTKLKAAISGAYIDSIRKI